MLIIPAIDIRDEKCVRLFKGDFQQTTTYQCTPQETLANFIHLGANYVHIVDLDGARLGHPVQTKLIKQLATMCTNKLTQLQVGGGIRHLQDVENLLSIGVGRVVIGSMSITNKLLTRDLFRKFGADKIVLALDCEINEAQLPIIKINGWMTSSGVNLWELLDDYPEARYLLCTDISVDGTMSGPNITLYQEIKKRYPHLMIIASGGVANERHLDDLSSLNIYGVVLGKALYEGSINLERVLYKC